VAIVYNFATGWNGDNHESDVDQAEVERLTKAGVDLLIRNYSGIQTNKSKPGFKKLLELATGLRGAADKGASWEVKVTKGIHQFTKYADKLGRLPHITAKCMPFHKNDTQPIHIWLSSVATSIEGRTGYVVRSVSQDEGGPFVPPTTVISAPQGTPGRTRGNSISRADFVLDSERRRAEVEQLQKQMGPDYVNSLTDS
jgi:hypothetical protein